jgi:hypothetical protein
VGSTLALAHPLYYDRLVQLASTIFGTIKFWRRCRGIGVLLKLIFLALINFIFLLVILISAIILFISCFCIDKIQKKIRLLFLLTFFDSIESLEFRLGTVWSNAVLAVERTSAFSSIVTYLCSPDTPLRASIRPCSNKQCSATFKRTSFAFERTCRLCYIFTWLRLIIVPTLECISAAAAVDPTQCMCSVFFACFI